MGTDIHAVVEVKDAYGDWNTVGLLPMDPCYPLFGALCDGMRGYGPGFPVHEGWPADAYESHSEYVDGDHSNAWFTLAEARNFDAEWLRTAYEDSDWPHTLWCRWLKVLQFYSELYEVSDDRVRAVYNFDS